MNPWTPFAVFVVIILVIAWIFREYDNDNDDEFY